MAFRLLADLVRLLHFGFVLFVVLGLVAILIGGVAGWRRVRNRRFRIAHLAAIGVVAAQAWLGVLCPLTSLEHWLRLRGGEAFHGGSFVAHWVGRWLYWEGPAWAFTIAYSAFGALVVVAWIAVRPERRGVGGREGC